MTSTYRIRGELERADPTIEPLPPTPITDKASANLRSWGLSNKDIKGLQELTSSFRYDLVPQKAERIARNGGYIAQNPDGTEIVVLPSGLNKVGRGDGHCGAIAKDLLIAFAQTGYLPEVNKNLKAQGKPTLEPCFVAGLSRTHFTQEKNNDKHVWVGLVPEGKPATDMITIDASFQEISTSLDNNYQTRILQRNISELPGYTPSSSAKIGSFQTAEDGIEYKLNQPVILGLSPDKEIAYSLGFLKDVASDDIRPVLSTIPKDSSYPKAIGLIIKNRGILLGHADNLTQAQREEMRTILTTLKEIPLVRDQKRAEELKREMILKFR